MQKQHFLLIGKHKGKGLAGWLRNSRQSGRFCHQISLVRVWPSEIKKIVLLYRQTKALGIKKKAGLNGLLKPNHVLRLVHSMAAFYKTEDSKASYLSIHQTYLCMYLSMYVPIYLCTYLSIYLSIYLPIYLFTYLSMYLSIHQSYLCMYLSIYVPIYTSKLSMYVPIYASNLSIYVPNIKLNLSIYVPIYLCTCTYE